MLHSIQPSILPATIKEINTIVAVNNYAEQEDLVLLNVGYTLMSSSCMLADNQWRTYFSERTKELIKDKKQADALIDEVKGWVVEKIPKVVPEEATPRLIKAWQDRNTPVVGYSQRFFATTYAPNNGWITSQHLVKMGIDLEKTNLFYPIDPEINDKSEYKYGIIFTNKQPVGLTLVDVLKKQPKLPNKVILVDDNLETLLETEAAVNSIGVECLGLRYTKEDDKRGNFDLDLAIIQFFAYVEKNQFMSDEAAFHVKNHDNSINYTRLLDEWILLKSK